MLGDDMNNDYSLSRDITVPYRTKVGLWRRVPFIRVLWRRRVEEFFEGWVEDYNQYHIGFKPPLDLS